MGSRKTAWRRSAKAVVLAWALAAAPLLASDRTADADADADAVDLSTPRATFDTFLGAMVDVREGGAERIDVATACFDAASLPPLYRGELDRIARDLKTYLDKVERIDLDRIPTEVDGATWVYRRTSAGEVSLARGDDDAWRFSRATAISAEALVESVRDRAFVEGLRGGGGARSLAEWIRQRAPDRLTGPGFILESWQWIALVVVVFVGVVLDRIVRLVVGVWLRRLLRHSAAVRDSRLDHDFERPIGILTMAVLWRLLLPSLDLPLTAAAALRFATELMMAGAGVWAAYRLVDVLAAHVAAMASRTDTKVDDILVPLVRRALKIAVVAFGVLFVAQNLDVDITSLLAGLGIGGIAFALAAKDTVENLFGSLTVLIDRPFQIGDWVVVGDQEGTVEEIGFRSTRIRTFYNSRITLPNSNLVSTAVDNLGARRYRRVKLTVGVQYDTPAERIDEFCEGIRELIRRHPYTRKDYYMVYFNTFGDSSLDVLLYAFFDAPDWPTELRERHRLLVDVVRLAQQLGVRFAFPTRTLHLASVPEGLQSSPARDARGAGGPGSGAGTSPPAESSIRIGRDEALALLKRWESGGQPPVDFGDPDRIRPA